MRAQFSLRLLVHLFVAGLLAQGSGLGATVFSPRMEAGSPVDIQLESWLDACPPTGVAPVRIRVRNLDKQTHTWTITSESSGGATSSVQITVEGGRDGERMLYAPVLVHPESSYYTNLALKVDGPGVSDRDAGNLHNSGAYNSSRTEFIGMSSALHAKGWSALEGKFENTSSGTVLQGSKVDIAGAPEDWRGYAGFGQLWLEEGEWLRMGAPAKSAMLEWVAMGGQVCLLCRSVEPARLSELALPPGDDSKRRFGAGSITAMEWGGDNLPLESMASAIRSCKDTSRRELLGRYDNRWSLAELIGPLTIRSGLIFGFITIFGILVGPVNLFLFAGTGRRQRLFWTTPLLSLVASGMLLALMILQDGVGGTGARTMLALMLPEQKRLAITQEQVSKTGVLLGRTFARGDADLMSPLDLNPTRYGYRPGHSRFNVEETETGRSAEWFSSRSLHGHVLQTVRPSRAGLEFFADPAGNPPAILSTVETPLRKVFAIDEPGRIWAVEDLGTGEKKVMRESNARELDDWMEKTAGGLAGPIIKSQLNQVKNRPGYAYAEAESPASFPIATLSSIRWNTEQLILAGPYVKH